MSAPGSSESTVAHGTERLVVDLAAPVFLRRAKQIADEAARASEGSRGGVVGPKSLSNLCELLLGAPLDKSFQLTNWERRPLSPAEREYAALDAWSVLVIRERLLREDGAGKEREG